MFHRQAVEALARLVRDGALDRADALELLSPLPIEHAVERLTRFREQLQAPSEEFAQTIGVDESVGSATEVDRPQALPTMLRYRPMSLLGKGGMGAVWLAHDRVLERDVALKLLPEEVVNRGQAKQRFIYEARATATLEHPGIIPVHDLGDLPDGRLGYVMQCIRGRSLRDVVRALGAAEEATGTAWPLGRLLEIFARVCLTVAYAHDRGMLHRDLKPANIMLGEYGEVYVADWGLAKALDQERGPTSDAPRTAAGSVLGTIEYMSPEQASGRSELGPAADVYSLGVILFELLTLGRPFTGNNPLAVLVAVNSQPAPDPRDTAPDDRPVPDEIAELTLRTLDKDPLQRPSASELAAGVTRFLDGVEAARANAERAEALFGRAREAASAYREAVEVLGAERAAVAAEMAALDPRGGIERRLALWGALHALDERTLANEQVLLEALEAARGAVQAHDRLRYRALLADLYWWQAEEAERAGDEKAALFFRSMVRAHDADRYADRLAPNGTLEVEGADAPRLERYTRHGPLLLAEAVPLEGPGPWTLPVGRYRLCDDAPDRLPGRFALRVEGNRTASIQARTPAAFAGHEAFAWIPPGRYRLGAADGALNALPSREVELEGFLIGRHPVTLAAYVAFLNALAARGEVDRARAHAPRLQGAAEVLIAFDADSGRFSVPGRDGDGDAWDARWPALMINWHDARAWCAWRTEVDGVGYRLPTEFEWEAAARGVDGRAYPWGDGFDAALCHMADSHRGKMLPAPVGSHPYDRSPFDVYDLAGGVNEWTATVDPDDPARRILRGGGLYSTAPWCRMTARRAQVPELNGQGFGFRVVRANP